MESIWQRGELREGSYRETLAKYANPTNTPSLVTTSCNMEVYKTLPKHVKAMESKLRSVQGPLAAATYPLMLIQDNLCSGQEIDRKDLTEKVVDTITIAAGTNRTLNQMRRELIKPHLDYKFQPLCQRAARPAEEPWLFGEDLAKKAKQAQEITYLTKRRFRKQNYGQPSHGSRGKRKYSGYSKKSAYKKRRYDDDRKHNTSAGQYTSEIEQKHSLLQSKPMNHNECCNFECVLTSRAAADKKTQESQTLEWASHSDRLSLVSYYDVPFAKFIQKIEARPFKAGAIAKHLEAWRELTSDYTLLKIVKGMEIDFIQEPEQFRPKFQIKFSPEEHKVIQSELASLLQKGVIELARHEKGEVISNIFTREKKDSGKHRVILNLSLSISKWTL